MRRFLQVWAAMARSSVLHAVRYRTNFLMKVAINGVWPAFALLFFAVVYRYVREVGGWSHWQVVVFIGTHYVVFSLFMALFFVGLSQIGTLVRKGLLDQLLTRPVHPLCHVSLRHVNPGALVNVLVGGVVVGVGLGKLGLRPTPGAWLVFALTILNGVGICYGAFLALMSCSFWLLRARGLMDAFVKAGNVLEKPAEHFGPTIQMCLTYCVPAFVATNYPARALLDGPSATRTAHSCLAAAAMIAIGVGVFRRGLFRYASLGG